MVVQRRSKDSAQLVPNGVRYAYVYCALHAYSSEINHQFITIEIVPSECTVQGPRSVNPVTAPVRLHAHLLSSTAFLWWFT